MTTEALTLAQPPIITFGYLLQVFFSLLIVLVFIYVGAKYLLPRIKPTSGGKLIKVLDRVPLEPQVTAYILQVGPSAWFILLGNKQVTRIDKLAESDLA